MFWQLAVIAVSMAACIITHLALNNKYMETLEELDKTHAINYVWYQTVLKTIRFVRNRS